MNRAKSMLIIILLIIIPLNFAVAGELKIYSSEEVQTLSFPVFDSSNTVELKVPSSEGSERLSAPVAEPSNTVPVSDPSKTPPDKWRKISERCIANCQEERFTSKPSLPKRNIVIRTAPSSGEGQSQ